MSEDTMAQVRLERAIELAQTYPTSYYDEDPLVAMGLRSGKLAFVAQTAVKTDRPIEMKIVWDAWSQWANDNDDAVVLLTHVCFLKQAYFEQALADNMFQEWVASDMYQHAQWEAQLQQIMDHMSFIETLESGDVGLQFASPAWRETQQGRFLIDVHREFNNIGIEFGPDGEGTWSSVADCVNATKNVFLSTSEWMDLCAELLLKNVVENQPWPYTIAQLNMPAAIPSEALILDEIVFGVLWDSGEEWDEAWMIEEGELRWGSEEFDRAIYQLGWWPEGEEHMIDEEWQFYEQYRALLIEDKWVVSPTSALRQLGDQWYTHAQADKISPRLPGL